VCVLFLGTQNIAIIGVLNRFGRVARHQTSGKGTGSEAVNWTNRINTSYEGTQYRVRGTFDTHNQQCGTLGPGVALLPDCPS
jgi:hypothetical protein